MDGSRDWTIFDRPELRAGIGTVTSAGCEVLIALDGIHCANCAARAESVLAGRTEDVHVNLTARTVGFRFQPQHTRLSDLLRALEQAGLIPRVLAGDEPAAREARERRLAFARIGVATICAMQVMMLAWPSYFDVQPDAAIARLLRWSQLLVAAPGVLWAGWPFFRGAWQAARAKSLDMNVPVALALAAAFGASALRTVLGSGDLYFDTATMFVWFLTLGRYIEGSTRARAGARLRLLSGRRALTVQCRTVNGVQAVAIGHLRIGDEVVVAPGDAAPADGTLLEQAAELDESLLTGESLPMLRQPGQPVLAGAVNLGQSPLALRVDRLGADTMLAQITRLLDEAQSHKPKLQQLTDRVAAHFVAVILLLSGAGFVLALLRGTSPDSALDIALAVLVASCPCALSLAVPVVLAAATSKLAGAGLLVANADALQALALIDTVLFDKTGTLTLTSMQLVRVLSMDGVDAERCTHIAAALEQGNRHPIATAFAKVETPLRAKDLRNIPGAGISGMIEGYRYWLGTAEQAAASVEMPPAAKLAPGETSITLCDDVRALATFTLDASLRPEAPGIVAELVQRGLVLELLSGDAADTVRALAQQLGIARYAARQTPAGKLNSLQQLQAQKRRVLAIGDGLNDAPLLASADVSACMPQGATLSQSRADLLLIGDTLTPIPLALDVARAAQRRIRENLCWALAYNLIVLPLAMSGRLQPWLAAAGMSISSLIVVANALRLNTPAKQRRQPQPLMQKIGVH